MIVRARKKKARKKSCFVIGPMGEPDSDERRRTERVLVDVIERATKRRDYATKHAKDVDEAGNITDQIVRHVVSDSLVVADLTNANANVFYELALRHAVGKPIIQLVGKGQRLPFNVRNVRTIEFDIDDIRSRKDAITKIVKQIDEMVRSPLVGNPVSAAHIRLWTPSRAPKDSLAQRMSPLDSSEKLTELNDEPLAETLPKVVDYMKQLLVNVKLLDNALKDLDEACALVNNVPGGGYISATSSLQSEDAEKSDADEHPGYRTAVNLALRRAVAYRKVICCDSERWAEKSKKWRVEVTEKANLIRSRQIRPNIFRLLHHPSPMSVDVVISQNPDRKCREMVAGFAGGGGHHGGFHTEDEIMVAEWLEVYLEKKIIAEAETHTLAVWSGTEDCPCREFLELLEEARKAIKTVSAVRSHRAHKKR